VIDDDDGTGHRDVGSMTQSMMALAIELTDRCLDRSAFSFIFKKNSKEKNGTLNAQCPIDDDGTLNARSMTRSLMAQAIATPDRWQVR
jgi:hypothetical protein